MTEIIEKLRKEILLSIEFGDYKIKTHENNDGWQRLSIEIDGQIFIIGINNFNRSIVFYGWEAISNGFNQTEKRRIINELADINSLSA